MRFRIIGLKPQRLLVAGHRLVELFLPRKDDPEVIVRLGIIRTQLKGLGIVRDRLIQLAFLAEQDPQVIVCLRISGP